MKRIIPVVLWTLVLVVAAYIYYQSRFADSRTDSGEVTIADGRSFAQTPWKHFPQVKPFQLTDQTGSTFSSKELTGKPYAVSFFFTNCPTICAQLNRRIQQLTELFEPQDLMFVSITCDPQQDTPEVLARYAKGFEAEPSQWRFLTEQMYKIQEVGRNFDVTLDLNSHTDDILLVDKWGRYRDRFKWDDALEIARFELVANQLIQEERPPIERAFETRNTLAGVAHNQRKKAWLDEFFLQDHNDQQFFSRDLTGEVWIGNLFFTNCTQICRAQTEYLKSLQDRIQTERIKYISISTDPTVDTPDVLRNYRQTLGIKSEDWLFLTGDANYIRRISEEFFRVALMANEHHSTELFVVDRWGVVRGKFDWQQSGTEAEMVTLIEELAAEKAPVYFE